MTYDNDPITLRRVEETPGLWQGIRDGVSRHAMIAEDGAIHDALDAFAAKVATIVDEVQVHKQNGRIREAAGAVLIALGNEIERGIAEAHKVNEIDRQMLELPPEMPYPQFREIRSNFSGLSKHETLKRLQSATVVELAALMDGGQQLSGMDDETWDTAVERARVIFHIEKASLASNFQLAPSTERIIVTGPDMTAAEAHAREALERYRARLDALEDAERSLQGAVTILSVITGLSRDEVIAAALEA